MGKSSLEACVCDIFFHGAEPIVSLSGQKKNLSLRRRRRSPGCAVGNKQREGRERRGRQANLQLRQRGSECCSLVVVGV